MKGNTDNIVAELNKVFGDPFLPKGFFQASPRGKGKGKGLIIKIGDRDIELDGKAHVVGSGSTVGPGKVWEIKRR